MLKKVDGRRAPVPPAYYIPDVSCCHVTVRLLPSLPVGGEQGGQNGGVPAGNAQPQNGDVQVRSGRRRSRGNRHIYG